MKYDSAEYETYADFVADLADASELAAVSARGACIVAARDARIARGAILYGTPETIRSADTAATESARVARESLRVALEAAQTAHTASDRRQATGDRRQATGDRRQATGDR